MEYESAGNDEAGELPTGDQICDTGSESLFRISEDYMSCILFIPASNKLSKYAGMHIWRMPRASNTPMQTLGY